MSAARAAADGDRWAPVGGRPGYWMIRWRRLCPFVAARIWIAQTTADPETGEPMDRSPFLAAQIGLDIVGWRDVWAMLEFCEASPEQQAALASPPLSDRTPRGNRAPAFQTAPLALWRRERARRISAAEYEAELRWHLWAQQNNPAHPDFLWRKPVDRAAMPVPRFGVPA